MVFWKTRQRGRGSSKCAQDWAAVERLVSDKEMFDTSVQRGRGGGESRGEGFGISTF